MQSLLTTESRTDLHSSYMSSDLNEKMKALTRLSWLRCHRHSAISRKWSFNQVVMVKLLPITRMSHQELNTILK